MKILPTFTDEFEPTLAEIKSEYVAYLLESAFPEEGNELAAEDLMEKALFFRLSVVWMGGHDDCVFALGKRNRSSH